VVEALAGKLSANSVNAPMVAPEVLRELQPYVTLAEGLGKVGGGFGGLGGLDRGWVGEGPVLDLRLHSRPRKQNAKPHPPPTPPHAPAHPAQPDPPLPSTKGRGPAGG
jgi:hypothetical protein